MTVIPIVLASLSLLVSVSGLLYTIRTYASSRRPYIGVVDVPFQLVENPPRAIVWKLVLNNVGTIPASVKIEENRATLTTPEGVSPLPSFKAIGDTQTYLMPNQTINLLGQYTEVGGPVQMRQILEGIVLLDLHVSVSYQSQGAFRMKKHSYKTHIRFHIIKGVEPGFSTVSAVGD